MKHKIKIMAEKKLTQLREFPLIVHRTCFFQGGVEIFLGRFLQLLETGGCTCPPLNHRQTVAAPSLMPLEKKSENLLQRNFYIK